jgi:hypothetical protein
MPMAVFLKKILPAQSRTLPLRVPRRAGQAVRMVLLLSNHQQPGKSYDPIAIGLKISKTMFTLDNSNYKMLSLSQQIMHNILRLLLISCK